MLRRIFSLVLVLFSIVFLSSCSKKEPPREVVLYCSADQHFAEPIIKDFEQQSGIKVLTRFDTEASKTKGLVEKLKSEEENPLCDVFWSSEIFYTIRLAKQGLLQTYQSDTANSWPMNFKDPQNQWFGLGLRARVIAYNTDKVMPEEAPKSLEDLLDSKWDGKIVMATPTFGTTGGDVASWFVHYGEDTAMAILNGLKNNNIRLVDGNSTAVKAVANGRADICLTDTDDVYAQQRNDMPVAFNLLNQGGAGVLCIPNTVMLIKNGPNSDEAKELMEFLLSEKLEDSLANSDSHNYPIHKSLQSKYSDYEIAQPLEIDYEKVSEQLEEAIRISLEILQ